jgi:CubicO group peptidase (beta-lactamase class C family)
LKLTAPDMLRIGQLYLDGGRWQGHQLVSSDWVKQSTANQLTQEQTTDGPYGYFWWVDPLHDRVGLSGDTQPHPHFVANGTHGQNIIVVPDARLIVVTVADDSGPPDPTSEYYNTLGEVILRPIVDA